MIQEHKQITLYDTGHDDDARVRYHLQEDDTKDLLL